MTPQKRRCAIYTRKSSEEGLEQGFNSLDAQREACAAYVLSQAGEGWAALATEYDDGGFSGGTMDRPGLTALLRDVDAGKIDIVVVYKVDRLTRSLTDFGRIVERFDAKGVSFVSVTQAFNTTTSMGRLTLNVLLSFAQFEREVTGERIRDKIAASKAKGMWMGGIRPLGYDAPSDPLHRALAVNPTEAALVRHVFHRYIELRSVHALERELDQQGILSKSWTTRKGRSMGGQRFSRGALFHLLKNRTYIGQTVHGKKFYPGLHPSIVSIETFEAAQAIMAGNAITYQSRPTRPAAAPLRGLIFDADGAVMSPTFGHNRHGKLYRYYVSTSVQTGVLSNPQDGAIRRVPAEAIERLVLGKVRLIRKGAAIELPDLASSVMRVEIQASSVHIVVKRAAVLGPYDNQASVDQVGERLPVQDRIVVDLDDNTALRLITSVRMKPRGGRVWITTPEGVEAAPTTSQDQIWANYLRIGHGVLADSQISPLRRIDPAKATAPKATFYRVRAEAALIAPRLQIAVLSGNRAAIAAMDRFQASGLPLSWEEQCAVLAGFTSTVR